MIEISVRMCWGQANSSILAEDVRSYGEKFAEVVSTEPVRRRMKSGNLDGGVPGTRWNGTSSFLNKAPIGHLAGKPCLRIHTCDSALNFFKFAPRTPLFAVSLFHLFFF